MVIKDTWNAKATNLLKAELARKGMTYHDLAEGLAQIGIKESANGINTKINRGAYSFSFFLQCMTVLGIKTILLDNL